MEKLVKFKVRDLSTGLYQIKKYNEFTGEPKWSKRGHAWLSLDELKKHFKRIEDRRITLSPFWEIVEISSETEGDRYPAVIFKTKN